LRLPGAKTRLFWFKRNWVRLARQTQILNAVFLIAEHKRAAGADAGQASLQQENSPAPALSSRSKFLADSPLVPALIMFIETLKVRIKKWLLKL
jgi:hypothetical protein